MSSDPAVEMRRRKGPAAILFALVMLAPAVHAGNAEGWFEGGSPDMQNSGLGTILSDGGQDDVTLEGKWVGGVRVTYNAKRRTGHEIFYNYTNTVVESHVEGVTFRNPRAGEHAFGYSFLYYATPEERRVRPFALGGVHMMHYSAGGTSVFLTKNRRYGLNFGGGVKIRVAERWGVRIDYRQYANSKPDFFEPHSGWIRQAQITGGVGFYF